VVEESSADRFSYLVEIFVTQGTAGDCW